MKSQIELYQAEDYNRPAFFYELFRKALEEVVDFLQFDSFADAGCLNGRLLQCLKRRYPHLEIKGYDVFRWAQEYAPPEIKDAIELRDLRRPFRPPRRYGIVNCTEVGEHLEPESQEIFLDNLAALTEDLLILSWSAEENPQHLNPRPSSYIKERVTARGFWVESDATRRLRRALRHWVSPLGFQWWAENVIVYQRKRQPTLQCFTLWQTRNAEAGAIKRYRRQPFLVPGSFQESFRKLTAEITKAVAAKRPASVMRVSDGEVYFLRKRAVGSAAPGRRGSTLPYDKIDISEYRFGVFQNDFLSFSPELPYRRHFLYFCATRPFFLFKRLGRLLIKVGDRRALRILGKFVGAIWQNIFGPRIPHEVVYSLVASRWIFRAFPDQIGLIGNERKLELIQELIKRQEYRDYLGMNSFADYVPVPQRGAADYPDKLASEIGEKIRNSPAKIFLVGMGHAKTAVLWRLKNYSDAVFIDVGVGIDAIAGCVCQERPHFADWINFRIKGYDYDKIDQMDYNQPFWDKSKYKTVWL